MSSVLRGLSIESNPAPTVSFPPKVGVVQITPWIKDAPVAQVKPESAAPRPKPSPLVKSPTLPIELLEKCAEITTDPFWKEVFVKAATGKWPRGYKFKENRLVYHVKQKAFFVEIEEDDTPEQASEKIIGFIKSRTGHRSDKDKKKDRQIEEKISKDTFVYDPEKKLSAQALNNKRYLSFYLHDFISLVSHEQGPFTETTKRQLYQKLMYGLSIRAITAQTAQFRLPTPEDDARRGSTFTFPVMYHIDTLDMVNPKRPETWVFERTNSPDVSEEPLSYEDIFGKEEHYFK